MKAVVRISMLLGAAVLLLWVGVAQPAEVGTTSVEYLTAMDTGILPSQPIVPLAKALIPAEGTWEYGQAMETGALPSLCGDKPCVEESFTVIEAGGIRHRLGVDDGGG